MIFHVRLQLRPRGGSQFYRDRSERPAATFCGAPLTSYDAPWADRNRLRPWIHPEHGEMVPCEACRAAGQAGQPFTGEEPCVTALAAE